MTTTEKGATYRTVEDLASLEHQIKELERIRLTVFWKDVVGEVMCSLTSSVATLSSRITTGGWTLEREREESC